MDWRRRFPSAWYGVSYLAPFSPVPGTIIGAAASNAPYVVIRRRRNKVARCAPPRLNSVHMRVIETSRLTLLPQTAAHANEMFVVLSDPAIYEFENEPPPSAEWLCARFTKLETRRSADGNEQWLNWVIRLRTLELVGYVQATIRREGRAVIAYELSGAFWGRGLAHEAVDAMITELFDHYGVRNFAAVLKRGNLRSIRLLERLGFILASPDEQTTYQVEPGEILMCRGGEPRV